MRSAEVIQACQETGSVYFVATGGAAALLAQCVVPGGCCLRRLGTNFTPYRGS
ncbi:MAG: fumarate hydratase C-terminal domain-containing protein [Slackia sp.]